MTTKMKILIIGAGISGMADYLFLRKHLPKSCDVRLFESYAEPERAGEDLSMDTSSPTTAPIGGGLGLSCNGMQKLHDLDPELYTLMKSRGYPVRRHQLNAAPGFVLGPGAADYGDERTLLTLRQSVWQTLRSKVPDEVFSWQKKVKEVRQETGKKPEIVLEDGTVESADLVIGADGLRSNIRNFIFGDKYPAHYEGLIGVGGVESSSFLNPRPADGIIKTPHSPCVMTFGAQGFVGYAPADQSPDPDAKNRNDPDYVPPYGPTVMWWSTYECKEEPDTKKIPLETVREQLIERHGKWKDPVLQKLISEGTIQGLYATYTVDKLPFWNKGCIVLTGDAAHAISPTGGQGVSQAFEDAHALALLLSHYISKTTDGSEAEEASIASAIEEACHKYTVMRKPRVDHILDVTRRMGNHKRKKSFIEEWITYGAMYCITRINMAKWTEQLYGYSVEEEVKKVVSMSDAEYQTTYKKSLK